MTNQELIETGKAYATSRYYDGYGYQVFVECYESDEWEAFLADFKVKTAAGLRKAMDTMADAWGEQYAAACCDM